MMTVFVGVDPGKKGAAVALISASELYFVKFSDDIAESRKNFILFLDFLPRGVTSVVIERVTASPQMGVVSAFTFGRYSEMVESVAIAKGFKVRTVRPARWQSALGCLSGGDKKKLLAVAKKEFPDTKWINLQTADACLIALFARYAESHLPESLP